MNDHKLQELLTGTTDLSKASLATRIFLTRLRTELRAQPDAVQAKLSEFREYVGKNAFAAADLANL